MACWPGSLACEDESEAQRHAENWAKSDEPLATLIEYALMATIALTAPRMLHELLNVFCRPVDVAMRELIFGQLVTVPKCDLAAVLARTSAYDSDFVRHLSDADENLRAATQTTAGAYAHAFITRFCGQELEDSAWPSLVLHLSHAVMVLVHHESPDVVWGCLAELHNPPWIGEMYAAMQRAEQQFVLMERQAADELRKILSDAAIAAQEVQQMAPTEPQSVREQRIQDSIEKRERAERGAQEHRMTKLRVEYARVLFGINAILLAQLYSRTPLMPAQLPTSESSYSDARLLDDIEESDAGLLREMLPWVSPQYISRAFVECAAEYHRRPFDVQRNGPRAVLALVHYRDTAELDLCRYTPLPPVVRAGAGYFLTPCAVRGIPPAIDCRVQRFQRVPKVDYPDIVAPYSVLAAAAGLHPVRPVVEDGPFVYMLFPEMPLRNMPQTSAIPFPLMSPQRHAVVWLWQKVHARTRIALPSLPLLLETVASEHENGAETVVNVHFAEMAAWWIPAEPGGKEIAAAEAWANEIFRKNA